MTDNVTWETGTWRERENLLRNTIAELRAALAEREREIARLREAIADARRRLQKARPFWNGPCHETAAVLDRALSPTGESASQGTRDD